LQIRVPKGTIWDAKMEPKRHQKQPSWSQKSAKMSQGTFKTTTCGTGAKKLGFWERPGTPGSSTFDQQNVKLSFEKSSKINHQKT
jgi:hypothetical protein